MSKLTPEQAWEHIKVLWPDARYIMRCKPPLKSDGVFRGSDISSFALLDHSRIDWPEGMDRWPPKELKYRVPNQGDVGKMVEVPCGHDFWKEKRLLHVLPENFRYRFIFEDKADSWDGCNGARIRCEDDQ